MQKHRLSLIGYASGLAGGDIRSGQGPLILKQSSYLMPAIKAGIMEWEKVFELPQATGTIEQSVAVLCEALAETVSTCLKNKAWCCVVGGDHTSAIGTWSGVYDAIHQMGELGLIWIDAHLDSHTPETSESGNIHGMPLACLLGYGYPELTHILHTAPKLKPEHVCIIGARSFERGEEALLNKLNVRIYFMEEVRARGFQSVLQEAVAYVKRTTVGYGITLDLDALDPIEVPGVDVPEPDGIHVNDLLAGMLAVIADPQLLATEVVEFDPSKDKNQLTEKFIAKLLMMIAKRSSF